MKEITVADVRKILGKVLDDYHFYDMEKMSDKQLLEIDLRYDFGLGSMDIEDMCSAVFDQFGIDININSPLFKHPFQEEETVENFIDMVNYCLNRNA